MLNNKRLALALIVAIMVSVTCFIITFHIYRNPRHKAAETVPGAIIPPAGDTSAEAYTDTIVGQVGEDTSMNVIQLLTAEGDTLLLDLTDNTDRRADLDVGRLIRVVTDENGVVIATFDDQQE